MNPESPNTCLDSGKEYKLHTKIEVLENEISDTKTASRLYIQQREEEMSKVIKNYEEELNFLQTMLNEYIDDESISYYKERLLNKDLERTSSIQTLNTFKDGLINVLKQFRKSEYPAPVPPLAIKPTQDDIDLETSMTKAKEESEKLKAIILPMEQEISWLKKKISLADFSIKDLLKKNMVLNGLAKMYNYSSRASQDKGDSIPVDRKSAIPNCFDGEATAKSSIKRILSCPNVRHSNEGHRGDLYRETLCGSQSLARSDSCINKDHSTTYTIQSMAPNQNPSFTSKFNRFHAPSLSAAYGVRKSNFVGRGTNNLCIEKISSTIPSRKSGLWKEKIQPNVKEKYLNALKGSGNSLDKKYEIDIVVENEELKKNLEREMHYRQELEEKFNYHTESVQQKLAILLNQLNDGEKKHTHLHQECEKVKLGLNHEIEELTDRMENMKIKMQTVVKENEKLLGMHSHKSQELQDQIINIPNNIEDLQLSLLRLGEDLITSQIAKEYLEEKISLDIATSKLQPIDEQALQIGFQDVYNNEMAYAQEMRSGPSLGPFEGISSGNLQLPSPLKPIPSNQNNDIKINRDLYDPPVTRKCPSCLTSFKDETSSSACHESPSLNSLEGFCQQCGNLYCLNCISRRTLVSTSPSVSSQHMSSPSHPDSQSVIAKVYKVCENCYRNALSM